MAVAATANAVYSFAQWSSPLSTQVMAWETQPELSPVSSALEPLVWLSGQGLGCPLGQRCIPSALVCGARGFLYLCLCMNVYSNQSILKTHPGDGRRDAAAHSRHLRPGLDGQSWARPGPWALSTVLATADLRVRLVPAAAALGLGRHLWGPMLSLLSACQSWIWDHWVP